MSQPVCSKCNFPLFDDNTNHSRGGQVKWCDACWRDYWHKERYMELRRMGVTMVLPPRPVG